MNKDKINMIMGLIEKYGKAKYYMAFPQIQKERVDGGKKTHHQIKTEIHNILLDEIKDNDENN